MIDPVDREAYYLAKAAPVIKWAGGKRQLQEPILKIIDRMHPEKIGTYYEPFAGGLAIFFALAARGRITRAVLSDTNAELMDFYWVIKEKPGEFIAKTKTLKKRGTSEETYYAMRASKPRTPLARAARFLYLNKTGFNGLYRVNSKNVFNVPFGKRKDPELLDEEAIWAAHYALQLADLRAIPFELTCMDSFADKRSFTYFDPPYWPTRPTANFTSYTPNNFGKLQQEELANWFECFTTGGVPALLSNSDVPETRELYAAFKKQKISARRNINSDGQKRGAVSELLVESTFRK